MIFGVFIGLAIGLYLGVPLLPLLSAFAVLQGCVAYAITRNQAAIRYTLAVVMVAIGTFLIVPMLTERPGLPDPHLLLEWFTYATYVVAFVGLVGTTVIGLFGGNGTRPTTTTD